MPTYGFVCQKCQKKFSVVVGFEEYDRKDPKIFKCPKCDSRKINQMVSNVFFSQSSKTRKRIRCACEG